MTTKPSVKPCPFCGGEASLCSDPELPTRFVVCRNYGCGVSGPFRDFAETAIKAWNKRRAPRAPRDKKKGLK